MGARRFNNWIFLYRICLPSPLQIALTPPIYSPVKCLQFEKDWQHDSLMLTLLQVTTDPSARTNSYCRQMCWKSPWMWDEVSMPVPMTSPPTVSWSSSGTTGIAKPRGARFRDSWPIVTRGSQRTV